MTDQLRGERQPKLCYTVSDGFDTGQDILKRQDILKAFHPLEWGPSIIQEAINAVGYQGGNADAVHAYLNRGRLEQLVLLAVRTLCSVQKEKQPRSWVTTEECRRWERQFDDALFSLENAVEAFEKAQEGGGAIIDDPLVTVRFTVKGQRSKGGAVLKTSEAHAFIERMKADNPDFEATIHDMPQVQWRRSEGLGKYLR